MTALDLLKFLANHHCDKTVCYKMCVTWSSLPLDLRACPSLQLCIKESENPKFT